jgi:hypothetical protein
MSYAERHVVAVTTLADGSAVAYSPVVQGQISAIHYVKPASGGYDDGVDFNIVSEATGQAIWAQNDVNASAVVAPRQATHSTAGVASLYAATGTAVQDKIGLSNDRVKIQIADGGNVKTGTFHIVLV